MTIPLQADHVYGPVVSRRFGSSLGVNILPTDKKVCNFDCAYCQYGASVKEEDFSFPPAHKIMESAETHFSRMRDERLKVDWIMIAGNGEPTLHPEFYEIVEGLKYLRDLYIPAAPIGLLSNSSTCNDPKIQKALLKLDRCFMKLDAGNVFVFQRMNVPRASGGPVEKVWGRIVESLHRLPGTALQSIFITGRVDNTGPADLDEWIHAVNYIHPLEVQIYTLDRPARLPGILRVPRQKLENIAFRVMIETGIPATVYDQVLS